MTGFSTNLDTPPSAMVICAHPDDAEFQCGATLAKWAAHGCVVHYLVCTDGSKGTWDVEADIEALVALRRVEQAEAAKRLGATGQVAFLGVTDGELQSDLTTRSAVTEWIRRLEPAVLLGHDPWQRYRLHPDHRHAGWLAVDGVVAARDPFFFPEHDLDHHRPDWLLLFEADEPDHVEDVTGFATAKVEALLAHESQFETTMMIGIDHTGVHDADQRAAFAQGEMIRLREMGALAGIELGEAYRKLDLR